MDLSGEASDALTFYLNNYEMIFHYISSGQKRILGDSSNKQCRFCERDQNQVSFRKDAHAISEFTGNKHLLVHYECDECNQDFGEHLEDHFAKFIGFMRTNSQIRGKNGVPSYKSKNGKSRIDMGKAGLEISVYLDDPIVDFNEKTEELVINGHTQPFIPLSVFKALVKYGINLLPAAEVENFRNTIKWIMDFDHDTSKKAGESPTEAMVLRQFVPGPMPFRRFEAALIRRKQKPVTNIVPYMFLLFGFGNYFYQVHLPYSDHDVHLRGENIDLKHYPLSFYNRPEEYQPQPHGTDLSSHEKIKGQEETLSFHVGNPRKAKEMVTEMKKKQNSFIRKFKRGFRWLKEILTAPFT